MERMIAKRGGVPLVSPSMREVPLERNQAAIDFANRLITGQIDVIIFLTGVGTRILVEQIERHVDRNRFLAAVSDIKSVVRGPKPLGGAAGNWASRRRSPCPSRTRGGNC